MELQHINTEGVQQVGELNTRLFREAMVEIDFDNAQRAARVQILSELELWAEEQLRSAHPYDDTRSLTNLQTWLADKIRAVHSAAPDEDQNASNTGTEEKAR